ncbi:hypothetical protein GCM10027059_26210 [Myceligenerans halotolerans]
MTARTRMPAPSIHAEALASAAHATAEQAGRTPIALAWAARARRIAVGQLEEAAMWLEALAVLGAPGAVVAAVLAVEPDAVPSDVLASATLDYQRASGGVS